MESLSRDSSNIIDFIARKKHIEKERAIREDPKMHLLHFLEWAYDASKPDSGNNFPTEDTPNCFEANFDNGKIKGRFIYERTVSPDSELEEEFLIFQELGSKGRNIAYKMASGFIEPFCYRNTPQNEEFYMNPDDVTRFLVELGAPYKHTDPFPFAISPSSAKEA